MAFDPENETSPHNEDEGEVEDPSIPMEEQVNLTLSKEEYQKFIAFQQQGGQQFAHHKQPPNNVIFNAMSKQEQETYQEFINLKQECSVKFDQEQKQNTCHFNAQLNELQTLVNEMCILFKNNYGALTNQFQAVETNMLNNQSSNNKLVSMTNIMHKYKQFNDLYSKYESSMQLNFGKINNQFKEMRTNLQNTINNGSITNDNSDCNFDLYFANGGNNNNNSNEMNVSKTGFWESDIFMSYKSNGSQTLLGRNPFHGPWSRMVFDEINDAIIKWENESVSPNNSIMELITDYSQKPHLQKPNIDNIERCMIEIKQKGTFRISCILERNVFDSTSNQTMMGSKTDSNHVFVSKKCYTDYEGAAILLNAEIIESKLWENENGQKFPKLEFNLIKSVDKHNQFYILLFHGQPQQIKASLLIEKLK